MSLWKVVEVVVVVEGKAEDTWGVLFIYKLVSKGALFAPNCVIWNSKKATGLKCLSDPLNLNLRASKKVESCFSWYIPRVLFIFSYVAF